ncbi:Lrp/AsnC family transcriptional regulator [Streptomyces sp. NPDC059262]|uniref:Lrp/AsnC family transcriptional regulator n=1 Tax=Streptomyces sp. NPDC059262 TaxID=3346797 RepID=UPI0036BB09D7
MHLRHDPSLVDETDLALVHALQTAPRAPWAAVGRALGIDPSTATRRWARLAEAGLAWVTCYPADQLLEDMGSAHIEVACVPGATDAAGRTLAGAPHVVGVEHVSGDHALLLTMLVPTLTRGAGRG